MAKEAKAKDAERALSFPPLLSPLSFHLSSANLPLSPKKKMWCRGHDKSHEEAGTCEADEDDEETVDVHALD